MASILAREHWATRVGVILAVSGSAVGLGNFLRFPGQVAQYGGGAFMLAYFISLVIIGLPICWAEWTMGRMGGARGYNSSPGIMHFITRHPAGKYIGVIGVIIPVVIYMYYVYIEAWCLGYAVGFLRGALNFETAGEAGEFFGGFVGVGENGGAVGFSLDQVGLFLVIAFLINFIVIFRGLNKGIELFTKYAMPTLVVLAVIILARVLTLGAPDPAMPDRNVEKGLGFMWNPTKVLVQEREDDVWATAHEVVGAQAIAAAREAAATLPDKRVVEVGVWEQLRRPQLWLAAAGQIFFSLSVGFGIILTYASYLRSTDDVVLSGLSATSANELCEVGLGGLITLPAAVAFMGVAAAATVTSTFGLGFNALPMVFSQMPFGNFFGFLFFFLLFLAAVTSSLSMLQPGIAFLEEALNIGRKGSVAILGAVTAVGTAFVVWFSRDLKALDTMDFWVGTFLIFVLATIQIIVFAWVLGVDKGLAEAQRGSAFPVPRIFRFVMKYLCPLFLLTIFGMWLLINVFGYSFETGEREFSGYIRDLFIEPDPIAWASVGLILAVAGMVAVVIAVSKRYRMPAGEERL